MFTLQVYNIAGELVDTIQVDPAVLVDDAKINRQLMHDAVLMYEANQRLGSHKIKHRGEVQGSKRKLYRQKGTGNARAGMRRSPTRRGGGRAHGPTPRDYSYSMPKKARRLATRMALLSKFQDGEVVLLDRLVLDVPKTKQMVQTMGQLNLAGSSCLIVTAQQDRNVYLSARNIPKVDILPAAQINAYALLRRKMLLLTLDSLKVLTEPGAATTEATEPAAADSAVPAAAEPTPST